MESQWEAADEEASAKARAKLSVTTEAERKQAAEFQRLNRNYDRLTPEQLARWQRLYQWYNYEYQPKVDDARRNAIR
jgi:hypothetical protein